MEVEKDTANLFDFLYIFTERLYVALIAPIYRIIDIERAMGCIPNIIHNAVERWAPQGIMIAPESINTDKHRVGGGTDGQCAVCIDDHREKPLMMRVINDIIGHAPCRAR